MTRRLQLQNCVRKSKRQLRMRKRVKHRSPYHKYCKRRTFLYLPPVFTVTTTVLGNVDQQSSTLGQTSKLTLPWPIYFHGANAIVYQEYSDTINTLATNASEQHTLIANVVQTKTTLLDQIKNATYTISSTH